MTVKKLYIFIVFIFIAQSILAQKDSVTVDVGKLYVVPLPILASNPRME